jgi:hypothetical protein
MRFWKRGVYYVAYIFMDLRSVVAIIALARVKTARAKMAKSLFVTETGKYKPRNIRPKE